MLAFKGVYADFVLLYPVYVTLCQRNVEIHAGTSGVRTRRFTVCSAILVCINVFFLLFQGQGTERCCASGAPLRPCLVFYRKMLLINLFTLPL